MTVTVRVVSVLSCSVLALAQAHAAQQPSPELREAMAIVAILYPELNGRAQHVVLSGERTVRIDIRDAVRLDREVSPPIQLSVDIEFDDDARLVELVAHGAFVRSDDNAALRERVNALPPGGEAGTTRWLRERGARFGPDRAPAFERSAVELERLVGAPATVQAGGFRWRNGRDGSAEPGWTLSVTGRDRQGALRSFVAVLEPVGGKVVRLTREGR